MEGSDVDALDALLSQVPGGADDLAGLAADCVQAREAVQRVAQTPWADNFERARRALQMLESFARQTSLYPSDDSSSGQSLTSTDCGDSSSSPSSTHGIEPKLGPTPSDCVADSEVSELNLTWGAPGAREGASLNVTWGMRSFLPSPPPAVDALFPSCTIASESQSLADCEDEPAAELCEAPMAAGSYSLLPNQTFTSDSDRHVSAFVDLVARNAAAEAEPQSDRAPIAMQRAASRSQARHQTLRQRSRTSGQSVAIKSAFNSVGQREARKDAEGPGAMMDASANNPLTNVDVLRGFVQACGEEEEDSSIAPRRLETMGHAMAGALSTGATSLFRSKRGASAFVKPKGKRPTSKTGTGASPQARKSAVSVSSKARATPTAQSSDIGSASSGHELAPTRVASVVPMVVPDAEVPAAAVGRHRSKRRAAESSASEREQLKQQQPSQQPSQQLSQQLGEELGSRTRQSLRNVPVVPVLQATPPPNEDDPAAHSEVQPQREQEERHQRERDVEETGEESNEISSSIRRPQPLRPVPPPRPAHLRPCPSRPEPLLPGPLRPTPQRARSRQQVVQHRQKDDVMAMPQRPNPRRPTPRQKQAQFASSSQELPSVQQQTSSPRGQGEKRAPSQPPPSPRQTTTSTTASTSGQGGKRSPSSTSADATPAEDITTPIPSRTNPSGYKGVYPARNGRWQAQVDHRSIGGFPTAWEAGVAVAKEMARENAELLQEARDEHLIPPRVQSLAQPPGGKRARLQ